MMVVISSLRTRLADPSKAVWRCTVVAEPMRSLIEDTRTSQIAAATSHHGCVPAAVRIGNPSAHGKCYGAATSLVLIFAGQARHLLRDKVLGTLFLMS